MRHGGFAAAVAALAALLLAGCHRGGNDDYPRDWPALAWSWKCPDLTGQWRLGGQPDLALGALRDAPIARVEGKTPVSWDAVSISFDGNRRMTLRFARNGDEGADRVALLPASLQTYADRLHFLRQAPPDTRRTSYESHVEPGQYRCSDNMLALDTSHSPTGESTIFLSRDRQGNLVAEAAERRFEWVRSADGASHETLAPALRRQWSHWPAITQSAFATTESTPHAPGMNYDAGPVEFGQVGWNDVEFVRAQATFELEAGAKVVELRPAGHGNVVATIEAPDDAGIRAALDHAAAARTYFIDLRRYDPTHAGAVRADVLLVPHDASTRMNMLIGQLSPQSLAADAQAQAQQTAAFALPLGEAQAAVLKTLPDTIVFGSLTPSPRGFRLRAHADDDRAVATLLRRLGQEGRFAPWPATSDVVSRAKDGTFEVELTPLK